MTVTLTEAGRRVLELEAQVLRLERTVRELEAELAAVDVIESQPDGWRSMGAMNVGGNEHAR